MILLFNTTSELNNFVKYIWFPKYGKPSTIKLIRKTKRGIEVKIK